MERFYAIIPNRVDYIGSFPNSFEAMNHFHGQMAEDDMEVEFCYVLDESMAFEAADTFGEFLEKYGESDTFWVMLAPREPGTFKPYALLGEIGEAKTDADAEGLAYRKKIDGVCRASMSEVSYWAEDIMSLLESKLLQNSVPKMNSSSSELVA